MIVRAFLLATILLSSALSFAAPPLRHRAEATPRAARLRIPPVPPPRLQRAILLPAQTTTAPRPQTVRARRYRQAGIFSLLLGAINSLQAARALYLIPFFLANGMGGWVLLLWGAVVFYAALTLMQVWYGALIHREAAYIEAHKPLPFPAQLRRAQLGVALGSIRLGMTAAGLVAAGTLAMSGMVLGALLVLGAVIAGIGLGYLLPNARRLRHLRAIQDGLPPTNP